MSSRLRLSLRSRGLLALALLLVVAVRPATTSAAGQDRGVFRPTFAVSETMAPFLEHLDPGSDAFRTGREAAEIQRRLDELTAAMRSRRDRIAAIGDWLLASAFRGGRLEAGNTAPSPAAEFAVHKASVSGDLVLDASTFGAELQKLMKDLREVLVAESPPSTWRRRAR